MKSGRLKEMALVGLCVAGMGFAHAAHEVRPAELGPYVVGEDVEETQLTVWDLSGKPRMVDADWGYAQKCMSGFSISRQGGAFAAAKMRLGEFWHPKSEKENVRTYKLPFAFPIAGMEVEEVSVGLNGEIDYWHENPETGWSDAEMHLHPFPYAEVVASEDGDGIFYLADEKEGVAVFRIRAHLAKGGKLVEFAVTLHADGRIVMAYKSGWSFADADGNPSVFATAIRGRITRRCPASSRRARARRSRPTTTASSSRRRRCRRGCGLRFGMTRRASKRPPGWSEARRRSASTTTP